jgi:hypothetical protein
VSRADKESASLQSTMNIPSSPQIEIIVIIDNELDPISQYQHLSHSVSAYGNLVDIGLSGNIVHDRGVGHPAPPGPYPAPFQPPDGNISKEGEAVPIRELSLQRVCCSGHGLSLLIVRTILPANAS